MNCNNFQQLIGMSCSPVGSAVSVATPFTFADGNGIEIFAQSHGPQVHFFDDGFTLFHLHSVGITLRNKKHWRPLKAIAESHGTSLSDDGVFETLCPVGNASQGFARLVSTLLGVAAWERDQSGVEQEAAWFVEEVGLYLKAWKPDALIIDNPLTKGFSKRTLKFHFQIENEFFDAIQPHGASTGAELRKIVDLHAAVIESHREVVVVIDDRGKKAEAAKQEIDIIGRVAKAWPMTALMAVSGPQNLPLQ